MKKHIYFILFITCLFILVSCNQQKTEWKGTIMEVDGVTIVKNPKEPMYTEDVFSLEEDLSIGEAYGPEEYIFTNLRNLAVDDRGNIYASDSKERHIKVFNDAGIYVRKIGRFGQGPGEIGFPYSIRITAKNEIMISDTGNHRLMFFSTEGELTKNIVLRSQNLLEIKTDSYENIFGLALLKEVENPRHELQKFDADLKYLCSFDSSPLQNYRNLNPFLSLLRWDVDKDNRVICCDPEKYEINIFNEDGKLEEKIVKDYKPLEVTEEDIRMLEKMPPDVKLNIPKFYPAFRDFVIDDEGRIFVLTWEKVPDSEKKYSDVFNREGKHIAKIALGMRTQIIKKNKLYAIEEDDAGYHCIKRYKVTWNY